MAESGGSVYDTLERIAQEAGQQIASGNFSIGQPRQHDYSALRGFFADQAPSVVVNTSGPAQAQVSNSFSVDMPAFYAMAPSYQPASQLQLSGNMRGADRPLTYNEEAWINKLSAEEAQRRIQQGVHAREVSGNYIPFNMGPSQLAIAEYNKNFWDNEYRNVTAAGGDRPVGYYGQSGISPTGQIRYTGLGDKYSAQIYGFEDQLPIETRMVVNRNWGLSPDDFSTRVPAPVIDMGFGGAGWGAGNDSSYDTGNFHSGVYSASGFSNQPMSWGDVPMHVSQAIVDSHPTNVPWNAGGGPVIGGSYTGTVAPRNSQSPPVVIHGSSGAQGQQGELQRPPMGLNRSQNWYASDAYSGSADQPVLMPPDMAQFRDGRSVVLDPASGKYYAADTGQHVKIDQHTRQVKQILDDVHPQYQAPQQQQPDADIQGFSMSGPEWLIAEGKFSDGVYDMPYFTDPVERYVYRPDPTRFRQAR